ncbi:MAG TPA: ABC transporter substrate-binding protein [Acidimicrobiia bacterium]|nr:ABC transporter substrate-binding protein [Acidimicrobiia bacterium]
MRQHIRATRAVAVAVVAAALALATQPAMAAPRQAPRGVDKSGILQYGADLGSQGGPRFDVASGGGSLGDLSAPIWMFGIYDFFIRTDENGKLIPGLATKWTTPDPKTVLVTIRSGVKFQDGTDFTPEAVKEGWDRSRTTTLVTEPTWGKVASVQTVGTNQVQVNLSAAVAGSFVNNILTSLWGAVPSPAAVAKYGDQYDEHPVGAGPYAFKSFAPDQKISLRRWSGYWEPKTQQLGGIDLIQTGAGAPTVASLQTSQINMAQISFAEYPPLKNASGITVSSFPATDSDVLLPCTTNGPFASLGARKALTTGIDRKAINQAGLSGTGFPTESLFPTSSPFYSAAYDNKYPYSQAKAKQLAKAAGITPGTKVKLMVTTAGPGLDRMSQIIQSELKALGFDVQIIPSSQDDFITDLQRNNPDLLLLPSDAGNIKYFLPSDAVVPWCHFGTPQFNQALSTLDQVGGTSPEAKAPWQVVQQVVQDQLPWVVVVRTPVLLAHATQVRGVSVDPGGTLLIWKLFMTST